MAEGTTSVSIEASTLCLLFGQISWQIYFVVKLQSNHLDGSKLIMLSLIWSMRYYYSLIPNYLVCEQLVGRSSFLCSKGDYFPTVPGGGVDEIRGSVCLSLLYDSCSATSNIVLTDTGPPMIMYSYNFFLSIFLHLWCLIVFQVLATWCQQCFVIMKDWIVVLTFL